MTARVPKSLIELDYDTIEDHFIDGEADHTCAITRALAAGNRISMKFSYLTRWRVHVPEPLTIKVSAIWLT